MPCEDGPNLPRWPQDETDDSNSKRDRWGDLGISVIKEHLVRPADLKGLEIQISGAKPRRELPRENQNDTSQSD
jgi:hypothetical protein